MVAYWAITLLAPVSPVAPVEVAGENRGKIDPRAVAEMFGAAPSTTTVTAAAAASNIQVLGITAGDARGSAVLSVDGVARFYPIGADLSDGSKLVAIKADMVVIERGGKRSELPAPARPTLAVLSIGKGNGGAGAQTAGAATRPGGLPASAASPATPAAPAVPAAPPFGAAAAGAVPQPSNTSGAQGQPSAPPPQSQAGSVYNPNIAPLPPGQVAPNMPNMPNLPNQPASPKSQ